MSRALLALGAFVWIPIALESRGILPPQDSRPALFLPAESPGWEGTLDGWLAAFDHVDVMARGEADLDDAVVLFGSTTTSQSTMVVGQPSPESQPRSSGLMVLEYQTKHLKIAEIEERLQEHGIRVRLDAPLDGATACVIKEVLRDLLAERGFADAEVAQRTTSPAARCDR